MTDMVRTSDSSIREAVLGMAAFFSTWVLGTGLGVVGAIDIVFDLLHHHHGIGPYLLAAGAVLLFIGMSNLWRKTRSANRDQERVIGSLRKDKRYLEDDLRDLRTRCATIEGHNVHLNNRVAALESRIGHTEFRQLSPDQWTTTSSSAAVRTSHTLRDHLEWLSRQQTLFNQDDET